MEKAHKRFLIGAVALAAASFFYAKSQDPIRLEDKLQYRHKSPSISAKDSRGSKIPQAKQSPVQNNTVPSHDSYEIMQESFDSYASRRLNYERTLDDLALEEMLSMQGSFINEILCKEVNDNLRCKKFSDSNSIRMLECLENDARYLEENILKNWLDAVQIARNINEYGSNVNADSFLMSILKVCSSWEFISKLLEKKDSDAYESYAGVVMTSLNFLKENNETADIVDSIRSNICMLANEDEKEIFDAYFKSLYEPCS